MQFTTVTALSSLLVTGLAAYVNTTVVSNITVTEYTTYCPEPTVITITKCDEVCTPSTITVPVPTTLTITGSIIVPTTQTTSIPRAASSSAAPMGKSASAASGSAAPMGNSAIVNGAAKQFGGVAAGVAAVAAALL
ncbi:hypothetical protein METBISCDRAFT_21547 [Metschnikowia bicuspidata]|uniref:GPI anchored serine-rich protein n=1 Tax=Metschnikowia bicuspidata TaxID=27322 RepID=A0A4P9ZH64_9ASCO|nr:hypothetical protein METBISCDRAFT_21547 [Metschnikowia bicuspidata]